MTAKDLTNIFWLAVNQGGNALFPLILMPLLFVRLGDEQFAQLILAEAAAFYVLTLCLYSFDVTKVKAVALAKAENNSSANSELWIAVLASRLMLFVAGTAVVTAIGLVQGNLLLLWIWLLFPLGMILQHNYFFQARAENKSLALTVLLCRLLSLFMVVCLPTQYSTLHNLSFIVAGSFILSGVIATFMMWRRWGIGAVAVASQCSAELKAGFTVFSGNLSVALYRNSNVIVLGMVGSPYAVSIYALAEKYVRMFQALARPLNDHYFAKIAAKLDASRLADSVALIAKSTWPQLVVLTGLGFAAALVLVLVQSTYSLPADLTEVLQLIAIMSVAVLFGVSNFMFGVVGLNTLNQQLYLTKALMLVGVCSVLLCFLLSWMWQQAGAALTFVLAEALLTLLILLKLKGLSRG